MRRSIVAARARLALLLVLLAVAAAGSAAPAPAQARDRARADAPDYPDTAVASFVRLVNAHRVKRGLPALIWHKRAAKVAQKHSEDMLDHGYFSHTSRDGSTTWDRLEDGDVTYSQAGENIAFGQRSGRAVLRSWLASRGHRENIVRRGYTHHGVGKAGTYWTHVFIRPRTKERASR